MYKSIILITLLLAASSWLLAPRVAADTMENSNYILHGSNLNSITGDNSMNKPFPESAARVSDTNFTVRSGFGDAGPGTKFTFTVSPVEIDFGTIVPGEPVSRTNTLSITKSPNLSYQITVFENHVLKMSQGQAIPDTTCDDGACSEVSASGWSNPLTYGFGYRCENVTGSDCSADFSQSMAYKHFANDEAHESAQVILKSSGTRRAAQSQITYKVNVAATQASGEYQNTIMYIASPTL